MNLLDVQVSKFGGAAKWCEPEINANECSLPKGHREVRKSSHHANILKTDSRFKPTRAYDEINPTGELKAGEMGSSYIIAMTEVLSTQDYPHIPENKKWQQRKLSLIIFVARRKENYLVENATTDVEFGVPFHYINSNAIEAKRTTITPEALCDE